MSRRVIVLLMLGVPLLALAGGIVWLTSGSELPDPLPQPANPSLPDLAMSPLTEIQSGAAVDGDEQYVGFTATVANVGTGALLIHAARADERGRWRVSQRFDEPDGSLSETLTGGELVWGGHGHDHWHLSMGASYWLTTTTSSDVLRRYEKVGFCFFDQRRLAEQPSTSPAIRRFPKDGCNRREALELTMGMSSGWADPYSWALPDQRLSVTGLPDGLYRLWAAADPDETVRESSEQNNLTWVDIRLTTSQRPPRVAVVRRGFAGASPAAAE